MTDPIKKPKKVPQLNSFDYVTQTSPTQMSQNELI